MIRGQTDYLLKFRVNVFMSVVTIVTSVVHQAEIENQCIE